MKSCLFRSKVRHMMLSPRWREDLLKRTKSPPSARKNKKKKSKLMQGGNNSLLLLLATSGAETREGESMNWWWCRNWKTRTLWWCSNEFRNRVSETVEAVRPTDGRRARGKHGELPEDTLTLLLNQWTLRVGENCVRGSDRLTSKIRMIEKAVCARILEFEVSMIWRSNVSTDSTRPQIAASVGGEISNVSLKALWTDSTIARRQNGTNAPSRKFSWRKKVVIGGAEW